MTTEKYGAYFSNGLLKGKWFQYEGSAPSTRTFDVYISDTDMTITYTYTLTYEVHPSADGTRNFYYQHQGDSSVNN